MTLIKIKRFQFHDSHIIIEYGKCAAPQFFFSPTTSHHPHILYVYYIPHYTPTDLLFLHLCPLFGDFCIFTNNIASTQSAILFLSFIQTLPLLQAQPLKQVTIGYYFWRTSGQQKCLPFPKCHYSLLEYHLNAYNFNFFFKFYFLFVRERGR